MGVRLRAANSTADAAVTLEECAACAAEVCAWRGKRPKHAKQQLVHVGSGRCLDARALQGGIGRWLRVDACDRRAVEQQWAIQRPVRDLCGTARRHVYL